MSSAVRHARITSVTGQPKNSMNKDIVPPYIVHVKAFLNKETHFNINTNFQHISLLHDCTQILLILFSMRLQKLGV
jgi:hypothetical protein